MESTEREEGGCGSTSMVFDFYLDKRSQCALAFSPVKFDQVFLEEIENIGMTRRQGALDVWKLEEDYGPATSFHSLEESHVRAETWPEKMHMNGEIQLCNFSRDNSEAAKSFVRNIITRFNPARAQILCIKRGPGVDLEMVKSVKWRRGDPLSL